MLYDWVIFVKRKGHLRCEMGTSGEMGAFGTRCEVNPLAIHAYGVIGKRR